jgi:HEPN domain-containing protein
MILGSANRKQTQARNMYDTERYPLAVRMSNQAREICNQADRLVRGSVGSGERARQLLDRLHDLHERVSDRAQETNNSQAMVFVRQSENLYQRARQQFDQTRYERSLHLLQQAETALKRAARMVLEAGDGERLRNDIERISQLIESATERLGDQSDPAILRSLERASRTLDDARLALDSDQPLRAMRLTQRARKDVERVLRQSRAGLSAAAVQREIDRFDERMIRLRDEVSDGAAIRQLNQAGRLRDDSEQALIKGEKEVALRTIRSALNLQRLAGETTR